MSTHIAEPSGMIEAKEAVRAALEYAKGVYPGEGIELTLEEIEPSDDERFWFITLGIADRGTPFALLQGRRVHRDYKVFKVDGESGAVLSMKIRSVEDDR